MCRGSTADQTSGHIGCGRFVGSGAGDLFSSIQLVILVADGIHWRAKDRYFGIGDRCRSVKSGSSGIGNGISVADDLIWSRKRGRLCMGCQLQTLQEERIGGRGGRNPTRNNKEDHRHQNGNNKKTAHTSSLSLNVINSGPLLSSCK